MNKYKNNKQYQPDHSGQVELNNTVSTIENFESTPFQRSTEEHIFEDSKSNPFFSKRNGNRPSTNESRI